MLNRSFFIFLFCFCFPQKTIHDFGDKKIVDYDFYFENPKNSWDELSSDSKKKSFSKAIGYNSLDSSSLSSETLVSIPSY